MNEPLSSWFRLYIRNYESRGSHKKMNISRAKIVLASLGLVLSGGTSANATSLHSNDPLVNLQIARSIAGLPGKLPPGWHRLSGVDVLGAQSVLLQHSLGENACFTKRSSTLESADELLESVISELNITQAAGSKQKVGGLPMHYVRGVGLWSTGENDRVYQIRGVIPLPGQDRFLEFSAANFRKVDHKLRATRMLLDSIKQIPV